MDPADTDVLEIPDEEEIEFQYQRDMRWTEEEYMRLLFQLRQHWYQSEIWDDLFRFVVRSRPRLMESHNYRMSRMISEWKYQQEKGLLWKEWAERVLNHGLLPEGPSNEEDWIPEGGNFRRYVSITNPPRMPDDVLTPPIDFASSTTDSAREGYNSPRDEGGPTRGSPIHEERRTLTPAEERDVERRWAVQEITASRQASAEQDGPRYDWDALYDAPLGLPIELPNRVSDPRTPPTGGRESTRELVTSQRSPSTTGSRSEKETDERNDLDDHATRGTGGQRENTLPAPVTTRRSRIPTPDPRKTTLASHGKGGHLGRNQGRDKPEPTTVDGEA